MFLIPIASFVYLCYIYSSYVQKSTHLRIFIFFLSIFFSSVCGIIYICYVWLCSVITSFWFNTFFLVQHYAFRITQQQGFFCVRIDTSRNARHSISYCQFFTVFYFNVPKIKSIFHFRHRSGNIWSCHSGYWGIIQCSFALNFMKDQV